MKRSKDRHGRTESEREEGSPFRVSQDAQTHTQTHSPQPGHTFSFISRTSNKFDCYLLIDYVVGDDAMVEVVEVTERE